MLVDSIKGEGMKKDFLFQNQKLKRGNKKIICEIDSLTAISYVHLTLEHCRMCWFHFFISHLHQECDNWIFILQFCKWDVTARVLIITILKVHFTLYKIYFLRCTLPIRCTEICWRPLYIYSIQYIVYSI